MIVVGNPERIFVEPSGKKTFFFKTYFWKKRETEKSKNDRGKVKIN
jgi:hypothetical protein